MRRDKYIERFCSGCGLCHSVYNIELKVDEREFPTAQINGDSQAECLNKICPVFYYEQDIKQDVWGIIDKAYVGYSSNESTRYQAASGGALTELCCYLLDNNIVNGIIHTTFDPIDSTKTISVVSSTIEEVIARCGSRYSISVPLKDILELVEKDKKYAFVGKPCDVMALRNYLSINSQIENQIQYLFSFYCAGEPSVKAQNDLLRRMDCSKDECKNITYRGNGWPGYTTVIKNDGTQEKLEYKVTWGEYLGRDLRNICRFCLDGTGDAADIVCADFWHLDENENPDFSEHEGRNIIISRNAKATQLIKNTEAAGRLTIESDFTKNIDSEFHKYQPAQYKRKGTMKSVILAMKMFGRSTPSYNKHLLNIYASHLNFKVRFKYFGGIVKRILKGKL